MPAGVVTVTSTECAPDGDVARSEVPARLTVTAVAGLPPKLTLASWENDVPVTVTTVPPEVGPACGVIPVTVGGP